MMAAEVALKGQKLLAQGVLAVTNDTPSFYRFIEDNFQSFIPWFVRDIR